MSLVITFFDTHFKGKSFKLAGKYFEHFVKAFPGYKKNAGNAEGMHSVFCRTGK